MSSPAEANGLTHNQSSNLPNLSNLPTQYSSSRFGNNNPNSRGGAPQVTNNGGANFGGVGNNGGSINFGAMSNSSHYARNMSPQPGLHGLVGGATNNGMVAPASGGYMGQGLDNMIGRLEPTGSEANSTSFYSNNTSAISHNLSNSRYLLNRRDTKLVGNAPRLGAGNSVGKVIPASGANGMTKSIDNPIAALSGSGTIGPVGYGSHTSNFSNNLSANNNVYQALGNHNTINHINNLNQFQRSQQKQ